MKWLLAVLALAGLAAVATHGHHWTLPDRHNPWAPLHYAERPNWLTRHKLQRLATQPEACLALMASTPWRFQPIAGSQQVTSTFDFESGARGSLPQVEIASRSWW